MLALISCLTVVMVVKLMPEGRVRMAKTVSIAKTVLVEKTVKEAKMEAKEVLMQMMALVKVLTKQPQMLKLLSPKRVAGSRGSKKNSLIEKKRPPSRNWRGRRNLRLSLIASLKMRTMKEELKSSETVEKSKTSFQRSRCMCRLSRRS